MEKLDLLNDDLQVSPVSQSFLTDAAQWGKFLSIAGFIFCGFIVVTSFFIPTIYSNLSRLNGLSPEVINNATFGVSAVYFVAALVLFFPVYFYTVFL